MRYSREGVDKSTRQFLKPYWFPLKVGFGIGVTAYTKDEALTMAENCRKEWYPDQRLGEPIEGISAKELDEGHVIPNMGPINLRGIWFPKQNI